MSVTRKGLGNLGLVSARFCRESLRFLRNIHRVSRGVYRHLIFVFEEYKFLDNNQKYNLSAIVDCYNCLNLMYSFLLRGNFGELTLIDDVI